MYIAIVSCAITGKRVVSSKVRVRILKAIEKLLHQFNMNTQRLKSDLHIIDWGSIAINSMKFDATGKDYLTGFDSLHPSTLAFPSITIISVDSAGEFLRHLKVKDLELEPGRLAKERVLL